MKEGLRDKHHAGDQEVKTAIMKQLKEQSPEFNETGTHSLIQRYDIFIARNGDNFLK